MLNLKQKLSKSIVIIKQFLLLEYLKQTIPDLDFLTEKINLNIINKVLLYLIWCENSKILKINFQTELTLEEKISLDSIIK